MPNYVAIGASDLHLDEHAWADRKNIYGDSMWAFEWLVDLAISRDLPLILAGDVLDRQLNNAKLARFLKGQLNRLSEASLSVYFVQGQHDLQQNPWLTSLGDSCIHLNASGTPRFLLGSNNKFIRLHGIDWTPASGVQAALSAIPEDTDILVMHQVTLQFMQELGDVKIYELDLLQVPYAKLLFIGDFHRHRMLNVTGATGQALKVVSPGSTNIRSINEPDAKYAFLIDEDLSLEPIKIPTRPKVEFEIQDESEIESITELAVKTAGEFEKEVLKNGAPEWIAKPLIRLRFDPNMPMAYKRISRIIGDSGYFFPAYTNNNSNTKEIANRSQCDKEISELGPIAGLPFLVDKKKDEPLFTLLQRLLTEDKPEQVLESERKKFFEGR